MLRRTYFKQGFTLIELSIVLVIIGLVAGGVMVGRDMIKASQMRKQITQLENYNVAVGTFISKYNCRPGDCKEASAFDLGNNGNGNGILENWDPPNIGQKQFGSSEHRGFWTHLNNANLIGDLPTHPMIGDVNAPELKFHGREKGGLWISDSYIVIGNPTNMAHKPAWLVLSKIIALGFGLLEPSSVYIAEDAYAIDVKMDDGLPLSGIVVSSNGATSNFCHSADDFCSAQSNFSTSGSCLDNSSGTAVYNILETSCSNATNRDCLCGMVIYNRP